MKMGVFKFVSFFGEPFRETPVWERPPQIEEAAPAPPQTAVPAPLPAPIWGVPVEMLLNAFMEDVWKISASC